jgi:hypothetical protein
MWRRLMLAPAMVATHQHLALPVVTLSLMHTRRQRRSPQARSVSAVVGLALVVALVVLVLALTLVYRWGTV